MTLTIDKTEIQQYVGRDLGVTEWVHIDQHRINQFADDTLDHQYIHIDPDRAKQTPFQGTIAHGMLILSLLPHFLEQRGMTLNNTAMGLNYGFDKVRFLSPVKVGSEVRGKFKLKAVDEKKPNQFQLTYEVTVEIKDNETPALIADWLALIFVKD